MFKVFGKIAIGADLKSVRTNVRINGQIENQKMVLNEYGKIVANCWFDLPNHYGNCRLDEFIIMPNYFYGIIRIKNNIAGINFKSVRSNLQPVRSDKKYLLSAIIQGFKIFSSRRINKKNPASLFRWQRSFHDHIISDNDSLNKIRKYIGNNPKNWKIDRNNPHNYGN